jgi:shikimate kinase
MMLSGKSTVGRLVALHLGLPFSDVDEVLEVETGRSITEWFALGEAAFRRVEAETFQRLLDNERTRVISTGGGTLESAQSRSLCLERAFLVYLEATPKQLVERLKGAGRPLLDESDDPEATLEQLLWKRENNYSKAHLRIDADVADPNDLVAPIVKAYGEYDNS